ncbi:unnamed protein product [Moneuplotes crassus]|uniref:Phosphatidylinositol-4-phosphate 5-kinase n=1 Tax=Euplotes crassus TaxID=5936 RepID=A0AAD1Y7T5_EUPCR|nr:unnamed protein product [Moneuplotes crassus]
MDLTTLKTNHSKNPPQPAPIYYKSLITNSKILSQSYRFPESKLKVTLNKNYRRNGRTKVKKGDVYRYNIDPRAKGGMSNSANSVNKAKMTDKAIPLFNEYEDVKTDYSVKKKISPPSAIGCNHPQENQNKQDFYKILMQLKRSKNRSIKRSKVDHWYENAQRVVSSQNKSRKRRSLSSNRCYTASSRTRQLTTNSFSTSLNTSGFNKFYKSSRLDRQNTVESDKRLRQNSSSRLLQSSHFKSFTAEPVPSSPRDLCSDYYDSAIHNMTNKELFTEPEWEDFNLNTSPKKKQKEILEKLKRKYKLIKRSYPEQVPSYVNAEIKQFFRDLQHWFEDIFRAGMYIPDANTSLVNFVVSEKGDIFIPSESAHEATGDMVVLKQNYIAKARFSQGVLQEGQACILHVAGDYYDGRVLTDGIPDGQGSFYYADGKNYDGQFVQGKRVGKGRLNYANKSQYIGQFIEDEANGNGIFIDTKGNRFMSLQAQDSSEDCGFFKNGKLFGLGEIRYENSNTYKGNFKNTKKEGYGVMKYSIPAGNEIRTGIYKGNWKRDMREGQGEMTYDNMSTFKGTWSKDAKSYGTLINNDGSKYTGSFFEDEYHGYAKLTLRNGVIIEGEFINGELKDKGKITFKDGQIFEGIIEHWDIGERGFLNYPDGSQYEGQFKFGRQHGFGIYTSHNGDKYEGKWEEGAKAGFGREFIFKTKEYYEGLFSKNRRHGKGKLLTDKGELYEILYSRGDLKNRSMVPIKVGKGLYRKQVGKFLEERHIVEPKVTANYRSSVCVTIIP